MSYSECHHQTPSKHVEADPTFKIRSQHQWTGEKKVWSRHEVWLIQHVHTNAIHVLQEDISVPIKSLLLHYTRLCKPFLLFWTIFLGRQKKTTPFFLQAYIFRRSSSDMLTQNFSVSSDYICIFLYIFRIFLNFIQRIRNVVLFFHYHNAYFSSKFESEYAYKR